MIQKHKSKLDRVSASYIYGSLPQKKNSLLCIRYRPSALGSEIQIQKSWREAVFPAAFTVSEDSETKELPVSRRAGGLGWGMMYNTCHCKGCKNRCCVHSVHEGKGYMEQRNTNKENMAKTKRSAHEVFRTSSLPVTVEEGKKGWYYYTGCNIEHWTLNKRGKNGNGSKPVLMENLGRLSFLLFLLNN